MQEPLLTGLSVSRETIDRLRAYEDLIRKWNKSINLISKASGLEIWNRHILDSAQLFRKSDETTSIWADLGSGGGLPGLVIAILRLEHSPDMQVHLVESDQRKAVFLRTVSTNLGLKCTIHAKRAEELAPIGADVVSARALASLDQLIPMAKHHAAPTGTLRFLKGRTAQAEIETAQLNWSFDVVATPSLTDNDAQILEISNVVPKHEQPSRAN